MLELRSNVRLVLWPEDDDPEEVERDVAQAKHRGFFHHALVEIDRERLYPVYFYDLHALRHSFEDDRKQGFHFFAKTGMIILEEITWETMQDTVRRLYDQGYFDYMRPVTRTWLLASEQSGQWPPRYQKSDRP